MSEVNEEHNSKALVWTKTHVRVCFGVWCFCCILLRFLVAGITMLLPYVAMLIFNELNQCFSSANHFNCGLADGFFHTFQRNQSTTTVCRKNECLPNDNT